MQIGVCDQISIERFSNLFFYLSIEGEGMNSTCNAHSLLKKITNIIFTFTYIVVVSIYTLSRKQDTESRLIQYVDGITVVAPFTSSFDLFNH